jgi:hypothetical protein
MRTERHTDGRTERLTDMTETIVAFRNLAKAPDKDLLIGTVISYPDNEL